MMEFPKFFKQVPVIETYDPLAELLGTFKDGKIDFMYIQLVKAAGHSCPTVAGAYAMSYHALKVLYPDSLPVRGEIKVEFKESLEDGVAGVIANVIANITGATSKSGFKGLGGKFARHSLMFFNAPIMEVQNNNLLCKKLCKALQHLKKKRSLENFGKQESKKYFVKNLMKL